MDSSKKDKEKKSKFLIGSFRLPEKEKKKKHHKNPHVHHYVPPAPGNIA